MNYLQKYNKELIELITLNILIKIIPKREFLFYSEKGSLIENNENLSVIEFKDIEIIKDSTIYDELIILKSDIINFSSIDEFVIYSILKSNYIDFEKNFALEHKIISYKKEISEEDFKDILEWGFFDLFNFEIQKKLALKYLQFKEAYTFFKFPSKPLFASKLDNNYYLFINNSYT